MIEDLFESAKQTWAERLASPLLGGFVASWGLWNWKFLVILFSDASVTTTFKLVETVAFPDLASKVLYGFMFPLASALAYVFVYPYPALKIYEFTLKRQRESNQVKQRISDEELLTKEETQAFKEKYKEIIRSSKEEIQDLNDEIARLRSNKNSHEIVSQHKKNDLSDTQLRLLKILQDSEGEIEEELLLMRSALSKIQFNFDIKELEKLGLIKRDDKYISNQFIVELSHEGMRYALAKKSNG